MKEYYIDHNGDLQEYPDMDERARYCDEHGHEGKCVTSPKYNKDGKWRCAYCARHITEEEGLKARAAIKD